jgi:hypothetical protein
MPSTYAIEEEKIQKALGALSRFKHPNVARAARDFDVNYRKLKNRYNGIPPKSDFGGLNKRLSDAQELAVCHYINYLNKYCFDADLFY